MSRVRQAQAPTADWPRRGHRVQGVGLLQTDYRSESYKKAAAAEKAGTAAKGSDGAKSDGAKTKDGREAVSGRWPVTSGQ